LVNGLPGLRFDISKGFVNIALYSAENLSVQIGIVPCQTFWRHIKLALKIIIFANKKMKYSVYPVYSVVYEVMH